MYILYTVGFKHPFAFTSSQENSKDGNSCHRNNSGAFTQENNSYPLFCCCSVAATKVPKVTC